MKRVKLSMTIALVPLALAAALLLLAACAGGSEQPPTATQGPTGSPVASATPSAAPPLPAECIASPGSFGVGLISDLRLDEGRRQFSPGQPIAITLLLTNCVASDSRLFYPTSQRYDFIVKGAQGAEVWRWSTDQVFAQARGEVTIRSGERVTYSETWDQRDRAGQQVPSGRYEVFGFSVGCASETAMDCHFGPGILFEITP